MVEGTEAKTEVPFSMVVEIKVESIAAEGMVGKIQ